MTDQTDYLHALSDALTRRGLDPTRTRDAVEEVSAHLRDSGLPPETEFGSPEVYADALVATDPDDVDRAGAAGPRGDEETHTFRATALDEVAILAELGRDGWELTGVRDFGLIARRPSDPAARQVWEYERRRTVRRQAVTSAMTTAGWELCGTWVVFLYFKRAVVSPARSVDSAAGTA